MPKRRINTEYTLPLLPSIVALFKYDIMVGTGDNLLSGNMVKINNIENYNQSFLIELSTVSIHPVPPETPVSF